MTTEAKRVSELQAANATLRARVAELETDHDSISATCDDLRARVAELETEVSKYYRAGCDGIDAMSDSTHVASVAYCEQIKALRARVAELEESLHHEREGHEVTEQARLLACKEASAAEALGKALGMGKGKPPVTPPPLDDPSLWPFDVPRAAPEPMLEGWAMLGQEACQCDGVWRTDVRIDSQTLHVGFTHTARDHRMGGGVPLPVLRALLATQGLRIVTEAEYQSRVAELERALAAARELAEARGTSWVELPSGTLSPGNVEAFRVSLHDLRALLATQGLAIVDESSAKVLEAELARRAAKGKT